MKVRYIVIALSLLCTTPSGALAQAPEREDARVAARPDELPTTLSELEAAFADAMRAYLRWRLLDSPDVMWHPENLSESIELHAALAALRRVETSGLDGLTSDEQTRVAWIEAARSYYMARLYEALLEYAGETIVLDGAARDPLLRLSVHCGLVAPTASAEWTGYHELASWAYQASLLEENATPAVWKSAARHRLEHLEHRRELECGRPVFALAVLCTGPVAAGAVCVGTPWLARFLEDLTKSRW